MDFVSIIIFWGVFSLVNILRYQSAYWVAFILLLIPFTALSDHNQTTHSSAQPVKLLLLGDSLSAAYGLTTDQGWVSLLQNKWHNDLANIEIVNAAISGETSDGGAQYNTNIIDDPSAMPNSNLLSLSGGRKQCQRSLCS
jgi:acyl-CoA thioesterase-1